MKSAVCAWQLTGAFCRCSHIPQGLTHTAVELTEVVGGVDVVEMKVTNPVAGSQTQAPQLQLCIWNLPTTRSPFGTQVSLYSGDQVSTSLNLPPTFCHTRFSETCQRRESFVAQFSR